MKMLHNLHGCYTGTSDILAFVYNVCDVFPCMEARHILDVCFVTYFHAWKPCIVVIVHVGCSCIGILCL